MCTSNLKQYFSLSKFCPRAPLFHIISFNWMLMISTALKIGWHRKWTHVFVYKQHGLWYYANLTDNNADSFFTLCSKCAPVWLHPHTYVAPTSMKHWRVVLCMYDMIISFRYVDHYAWFVIISFVALCVPLLTFWHANIGSFGIAITITQQSWYIHGPFLKQIIIFGGGGD